MNYAGIVDAALFSDGPGAHSHGYAHLDAPPAHAPSDAILVPDAHFLFNADFARSGTDLILSGDGGEVVLHDYFKGEKRAPLASPDGAHLTGDLVNALTGSVQVSQADGTASAGRVIGHVTKLQGTATAIRNGVSIILHQGDNVEKGDVVQSGSNSTLGISFIDGTVFGMASNARMVLNEMVYDPNGSNNSSLISLVAGTISFVAGATAKYGDMKIDTPVATMGIRGTAVLVEIDFTVPGQGGTPNAKFQVLVEPDGTTGSYVLFDKTTLQPIAVVNQAGQQVNISNGLVTQSSEPLSPDIQKLITDVFSLKFTDNTNPKSTTHFTDVGVLESLAPIKLANGATATPIVLVTNSTVASASNFQGEPPQHLAGKPAVAVLDASGHPSTQFSLTELANKTADAADLDTISGKVNFVDVNVGDQPTTSVAFKSFTYANSSHADVSGSLNALALQAIAATEVKINVVADPGNKNHGSATWTYSVPDNAFDFLAAGETLTLTYIVRVDNNFALSNEYTEIPITITVTGTNDKPEITTGARTVAFSGGTSVQGGALTSSDSTSGTLSFSDVDLADTHTVSAKLITPQGDIPPAPYSLFEKALSATLAADSTGSGKGTVNWSLADLPVYVADFIPAGQTLTLTYVVTVTDSQGATSEQTVTVTITGTDAAAEVWIATTGGQSPDSGSAAPILLWSEGAHWETGVAPTANDDVIIITNQLIGLTPAFPVTIDAAAFAKSVTMNDYGGGPPPELDNLSSLTIGGALTVKADAGVHNFRNATINVGGKVEFLDHSVLGNAGTLLLAGGGDFGSGATITNTGTIELAGGVLNVSADVFNSNDSGSGLIQVDAAATLILDGGGIEGGRLAVAGTLEFVGAGFLSDGRLDNAGAIQLDAGAVLVLQDVTISGGGLFNAGTVHVETGLATTFDDVTIDNSPGVIIVDDAGDVPVPSTLILNGDTTISGGSITVGYAGMLEVAGAGVMLSDVVVDNSGLFQVDLHAMVGLTDTTIGGGLLHIDGTIESRGWSNVGGTIFNAGTIEVASGKLDITGTISGTGLIIVDTGARLEFDGSATQTVDLAGHDGELVIGADFHGKIQGFDLSDKLDLSGVAFGDNPTVSYDGKTGVLIVSDSHGHTVSLTLTGADYGDASFMVSNDGHGGTLITLKANDVPVILGETDPSVQTVILSKTPVALAVGMNTNAAGLATESFDQVPAGAPSDNGLGYGNFYSEALHATFSAAGNAGVVPGPWPHVSTAPILGDGTLDHTHYLSIGGQAQETITFDSQQNAFGLYWGSVDPYNSVEFYDGDRLVASYSGRDVSPLANGGHGVFTANGYVEFLDLAPFTKVVLGSGLNAFELDNVSAGYISDSHVKLADEVAGTLTVTDKDIGDTLTAAVIGDAIVKYVKYDGTGHLPGNVDVAALTNAGAVTFDSVTSDGKADVLHWSYHPTGANLDFLEPGDTLTITFEARVSDGHGSFGLQPLIVSITGDGSSVINGTAQNDTFADVGGGVTIFGKAGNDTFVFNPHFGSATIADFDVSKDAIEIDHTLFATAQEILAAAQSTSQGHDTVITDAAHDMITLKGVTIAQLTAHQNDFHFV